MFCSKCGKTVPNGEKACQACGFPVGESLFLGSAYTSAQTVIRPNDDEFAADRPEKKDGWTKLTYTGKQAEAQSGDTDTRTVYRPVFEGGDMPQDIREGLRAAVHGTAEKTQEAADAEAPAGENGEETKAAPAEEDKPENYADKVDLSKFRARRIESAGQSGISSDVDEIIREIDNRQNAEAAKSRGRRRVTYGDYGSEEETTENTVTDDNEEDEVFDPIEEEELDDIRNSKFGIAQILKIILVVIVAAVLFVGGVMYVRHISANTSSAPIADVTENFYNSGIEMIRKHANSGDAALAEYSTNGLSGLSVYLGNMSTELAALLPAEARDNDSLFLRALQQIETNIANCITSDALAVGTNDAESIAGSDARWAVVEGEIAVLAAATRPEELTAIVNGETVDVVDASATPSPTPAPNYNTLSKGDKSDAVLDLQNRLYELGFLLGDRDGAYGSQTQTAIKMFQQMAGLTTTGIADSATQAKLWADDAPRTEYAQTTPEPMFNPDDKDEPAEDSTEDAASEEAASEDTDTE